MSKRRVAGPAKAGQCEADEGDQKQPEPIIQCPADFGPVARQEWDRIVPFLTQKGAILECDRAALAIYCTAYSYWIEATEALQKYGTMMKAPSGYPVQSPYMAIANAQAEIMLKISQQFGFSPASRGRRWMLTAKLDSSSIPHLEELVL